MLAYEKIVEDGLCTIKIKDNSVIITIQELLEDEKGDCSRILLISKGLPKGISLGYF